MNLKMFARLDRRGRRLVWGGALAGLMLAAGTTAIGDVHPDAKRLADQRRESLSLFAGPTAVLQGNQMQCGIRNNGDVCSNVFNSPTGGGGFWPTGSQNQYIFNTGLQIAGIMGPDGGPWANDTVGAYFFDARGTQPSGTPLTDVYNSLNSDDIANWPADAFVSDPDIFQEVLVGRATASQQDSWVQYWDGDPARISARAHPMGISVTQRSLAWNYPAGNESLIYFLYNFKNTTALADPQGAEFQRLNESQFFAGANELPDAGITLTNIYAAFSTDMDVTANAGQNFSTAVLPFDLGISYHGGFSAPEFTYFPDLFFAPFFTNAPGLIGVKYLRSPINPETDEEVGLTLFSATLNQSTGFPDPVGDKQLFRYLSGKLNPAQGDNPCNVTPEIISSDPSQVQRSLCFLFQTAADTRFYQASGPFTLNPGDEGTIVVAYIAAATVATMPDGSPSGIIANSSDDSANPPGVPSFHPGFPSARGCEVGETPGSTCDEWDPANPVKALERGAGWVAYTGPGPDTPLESPANKLDQRQVTVVPGSLLGRSLVAQTIFDSRFLLGFAPEQPSFYLVPGDNQVTVVWDPSTTEDTDGEGDPFFAVAGDSTSALYNPNYRQFDVEGYRVWRGTTSGALNLIAQYDFANTTFTDVTCETVAPAEDLHDNSSAPEGTIGYVAGEECPADFSKTTNINSGLVFNNGSAGGNPGAGVFRLADGSAAYSTDPIVAIESDEGGAKVPLTNSGVPYVHVDTDVVNNFTYFYAVSAFDVNSPASGPHSLRSARVAQSVVPRADSPNIVGAELSSFVADGDGNPLTQGTMPGVDEEDGTFLGPIPPTNIAMISQSFAPLVPRLLPSLDLQATIDSVKPDWELEEGCVSGAIAFQSTCWRMWMSVGGSQIEVAGEASNWHSFGRPDFTVTDVAIAEVPFDQDALDAFGIPSASGFATASFTLDETINFNNWEGQQNRRAATPNTTPGGPRWFSGTAESTPDPTAFIRVGHLAEVDSVWIPIHHTDIGDGTTLPNSGTVQYFGYYQAFLGRSADIQVTWGEGGTLASVRDVTHNVDVPFSPDIGSSWGFMNTDADGSGAIDWVDFFSLGGDAAIVDWAGGPGFTLPPATLEMTPTIQAIGLNTENPQGQTHTGFALYLNAMRHFFVADAPPPAGTVWTLRNYHGAITSSGETALSTDPSGYAWQPVYDTGGAAFGNGSPLVPGLTLSWQVENATNFNAAIDLTQVHTVPDPYLGSSLYDRGPTTKQLMFVNLPPEATIRIYTLTGVLVDVLVHDDITGGGRAVWDIRNRNNQFVASGVYFFHVMTPDGDSHVGKFTIINQAGSN